MAGTSQKRNLIFQTLILGVHVNLSGWNARCQNVGIPPNKSRPGYINCVHIIWGKESMNYFGYFGKTRMATRPRTMHDTTRLSLQIRELVQFLGSKHAANSKVEIWCNVTKALKSTRNKRYLAEGGFQRQFFGTPCHLELFVAWRRNLTRHLDIILWMPSLQAHLSVLR